MKPTYDGFEARRSNFIQLPPPGAYVAEIQAVRTEQSYNKDRDEIVLMIEITEGEFAGQYHKVFEEQKERFGDSVEYRGTFKLRPYLPSDDAWVKSSFEGNIWAIQESNPGYAWDWDESKLKGKKVGISIRKTLYTGNDGSDKETTEIGRLESIDDVKAGKCKLMKERDGRKKGGTSSKPTDVTDEVEVPF